MWWAYGIGAAAVAVAGARVVWPERVWLWTVLIFCCAVGLVAVSVSLAHYARRTLGAAHEALVHAEVIDGRIEEKLHDLEVAYFLIDPDSGEWRQR